MKVPFLKIVGAVAVINIMARLFGFAREVVIGYQYGTSFLADSIITAYTIPNFMYIVVGGAITTAFISVYGKFQEKELQKDFISTTFTYLTVIVGIVTVLLLVFAEPILQLLFGGMDKAQFEKTLQLYFWMAPSTFFLVMAMWLSGILNVHERYQLSSMSTLLYNAAFLGIAVTFTFMFDVYSYGIGALIAAVLMVLLLLFGLSKDIRKSLRFRFHYSPELKRLFIMAIPILLGGATLQFYLLIQRVFAADLQEGYIAALNYASKLTQFPQAVLMTAVTTVIYPLLAKKVGEKDHQGIEELYKRGLGMLNLLLIPVTIFVFFYSEEMIKVIFQYGSFTTESTAMTVPLLQISVLSMFALATNVYVTRFFYANEISYLPVIISIICVFGVNVAVVFVLLPNYGAEAIAWGTTISAIVNLILLQIMAKFVLKLSIAEKFGYMGKSLLFYISVAISTWTIAEFMPGWNSWIRLIIGGFSFILVVFVFMKVFGIKELQVLLKRKKVA